MTEDETMTLPSKGFPLFLLNLLLGTLLFLGVNFVYALLIAGAEYFYLFLFPPLPALLIMSLIMTASLGVSETHLFGKEKQLSPKKLRVMIGFILLNVVIAAIALYLFANLLVATIFTGASALAVGVFVIPPIGSFLCLVLACFLLGFEKRFIAKYLPVEQGEEKAKHTSA
jgi:hypothetical protein